MDGIVFELVDYSLSKYMVRYKHPDPAPYLECIVKFELKVN